MIPPFQMAGPPASAIPPANPAIPSGDGGFAVAFGESPNAGGQVAAQPAPGPTPLPGAETGGALAVGVASVADLPPPLSGEEPSALETSSAEGREARPRTGHALSEDGQCADAGSAGVVVPGQTPLQPPTTSAGNGRPAEAGIQRREAAHSAKTETAVASVAVASQQGTTTEPVVVLRTSGEPAHGGAARRESVILAALHPADADTGEGAGAPQADRPDAAPVLPGDAPTGGEGFSDGPGAEAGAGSGQNGGLRADRTCAALASLAPPDRTPEQAVLRQLSEVLSQGPSAHRAAEISFSAQELGRLSMTVAQDGGLVCITLAADRPDTLDLLRRNIDLLARDLRDLGFQSLNFSFQNGPGSRADSWQTEPAPSFAEASADRGDSAALLPRQFVPQPASATTLANGGLDLRL